MLGLGEEEEKKSDKKSCNPDTLTVTCLLSACSYLLELLNKCKRRTKTVFVIFLRRGNKIGR